MTSIPHPAYARLHEVERERDALLAALRDTHDALLMAEIIVSAFGNKESAKELRASMEKARAAIAKAEGQS
jgi:hypothetical protein